MPACECHSDLSATPKKLNLKPEKSIDLKSENLINTRSRIELEEIEEACTSEKEQSVPVALEPKKEQTNQSKESEQAGTKNIPRVPD